MDRLRMKELRTINENAPIPVHAPIFAWVILGIFFSTIAPIDIEIKKQTPQMAVIFVVALTDKPKA